MRLKKLWTTQGVIHAINYAKNKGVPGEFLDYPKPFELLIHKSLFKKNYSIISSPAGSLKIAEDYFKKALFVQSTICSNKQG